MMAEQLVHLPFIEKNVNIEQSFANLQFVVWASALFLSIGSIAMVFATGRSYGTCKTCGSRVSSDKLIGYPPLLHSRDLSVSDTSSNCINRVPTIYTKKFLCSYFFVLIIFIVLLSYKETIMALDDKWTLKLDEFFALSDKNSRMGGFKVWMLSD